MSLSQKARVLVVGSGGREHALAAALASSPSVGEVAFAGGPNAGLEAIAQRIMPSDVFARAKEFDLVVIGPEAPLVDGIADRIGAQSIPVFGPSAAAAQLEASKAFTKDLCVKAGIPTADAKVCETEMSAFAALWSMGAPIVVKADGLAAGKGVVVATTNDEAEAAIKFCFSGGFGSAGAKVLLEERLEGPELSLFALCDGTTVKPLATARDYKRAFDRDEGSNTGGMGAISPAPDVPPAVVERAMAEIVRPAIETLAARGTPYVGVLYAGLILTAEGPKLIEFNVRFGDPECQAIMPLLATDPFELMHAVATGRLAEIEVAIRPETAVAVVVASAGYPQKVEMGEAIGGLDALSENALLYHAATRRDGSSVFSNGGRVLGVVARGEDGAVARARVYRALEALDWPGGRYRRDIGL